LVIGAFLAGIALSVFPVSGILRGQLTSISDFSWPSFSSRWAAA
jgi:Kef-type K+ transport system membrane component KefB